jgi:HAD superfamily hydrolase (TIGR01490 family)
MQQRPFAVFDIDGTLIRWQMFHAIVHHLGKNGHIPQQAHDQIRAARMEWKTRDTSEGFKQYEHVLVQAYRDALIHINPRDYTTVVGAVFEEYKDQTYIYTRDLVRSLKEQGYLLFAISGSQEEIINKLAAHHGFDAAIGAKLEIKNGAYSGDIETPIFDKRSALERLIQEHNPTIAGSIAVGDSLSDASMLEMVEKPIAFNPDRPLFEVAQAKGWEIVVERKNMTYELRQSDGRYVLA